MVAFAAVPAHVGARAPLTPRFTCGQRARSLSTARRTRAPVCVVSAEITEGHDRHVQIGGSRISYDYFKGSSPTIVFLPGFFYSRWRQAKANALEIFAKRKGQAILVEEYLGIGRSGGDFGKEGTLSRWISDTVHLIDTVVGDGPVVLVGAGVGGWIMLHVAQQRPRNVVGMVGINASVDFTEDLIAPAMTDEQRAQLERDAVIDMQWGFRTYPIGKALLADARKWLVLRDGPNSLNIQCPVRLIQGLSDEEIPPSRALKLVEALQSDDVTLSLIKYGDHVLESDDDYKRMWDAICEVSEKYFDFDLTSPGSG